MHKYLLTLATLLLFLTGCEKEEDDHMEVDKETIQQYLIDNDLEATEHSSGIFYNITKEGVGENPTSTSTITINYKGKLLDGTVFDESVDGPRTFALNTLIKGWQHGIPLIKSGGKITLYIPSALGYGSRNSADIPAYSVLIFDIELIQFM